MNDRFFTVSELAKMFDVSRQTIHNWIEDGKFPNWFTVGEGGGKMTLVPASDVESMREEEAKKLVNQLNSLGFRSDPA